jgi:hypothetical protein
MTVGRGGGRELLHAATVLSLFALTWTYSPAPLQGLPIRGSKLSPKLSPKPPVGPHQHACTGVSLASRVGRRGVAAASMKDGAIGRGRGAMSQEQFDQAQKEITRSKTAPLRTPEEARRNSRTVRAGEISPSQPTQQDAAFLRTKAAHAVRGPVAGAAAAGERRSRFSAKQQAEAALRGKVFVPKSDMSAADLSLMRQRKELARQVLARNAPPTEEGVVYVPEWNENEAGKTLRTAPGTTAIGKAPAPEDLSPVSALKPPLEVIEMLRTMNFFLRDTFRARAEEVEAASMPVTAVVDEDDEEEELDLSPSEMDILRVRLLRDHWVEFVEDNYGVPLDDAAQERPRFFLYLFINTGLN